MFFLYVYIITSLYILNRSLEVFMELQTESVNSLITMTGVQRMNFSTSWIRVGHIYSRQICLSREKKLKRFNSLFWNPDTERVNAFSVSWGKESNWPVPTTFLISSTILHVISCKAKGTLIVLQWPLSPFWPLLLSYKFESHSYVADLITFESPTGIFKIGKYKDSLIDQSSSIKSLGFGKAHILFTHNQCAGSCHHWHA